MRESHQTLSQRHSVLPRGTRVVEYYMPRMAPYAFGDSRALQVWYHDSTLRMIPVREFDPSRFDTPVVILEYEPHSRPQLGIVETAAMREYLSAQARMGKGDWAGALPQLARADSMQRDPRTRAFHSFVAGWSAMCLITMNRYPEAEREARRGTTLLHENVTAHYAFACMKFAKGDFLGSSAELDTALAIDPNDPGSLDLRPRVLAALRAR
jgi:hypothetical protein